MATTHGTTVTLVGEIASGFTRRRPRGVRRTRTGGGVQALLDAIAGSAALLDEGGRLVAVNATWCEFGRRNGLPDPESLVGSSYLAVCDAATGADADFGRRAATGLRAVLAGELPTFDMSYTCHSPVENRWLRLIASGLAPPAPGRVLVVHADETTTVAARFELRMMNRLLRSVSDGALVADARQRIVTVNRALLQMTGLRASEVVGRPWTELVASPLRAEHVQSLLARSKPAGTRAELPIRRKGGAAFPAYVRVVRVVDETHGEHSLIVVTDVSRVLKLEEQVTEFAERDALTGLKTRDAFIRLSDLALASDVALQKTSASMLLVGIDALNLVNDTLGYEAGDELLRQFAHRLESFLPRGDLLARVGSDEFAVCAFGSEAADVCTSRVAAVHAALSAPFVVGDLAVSATAGLGVASYPLHGRDAATLLQRADVALREAKRRGPGTFWAYDDALGSSQARRLRLQTELRDAIDRNELCLHYQPTIDVASGNVIGIEALVRWRHPQRGLLGPAEFVPDAEESGLSPRLCAWVLQAACAEVASLPALDGLSLAVNVSARDFSEPDVAESLAAVLERTSFPAGRLRVEITETMVMGSPIRARAVLQRLSEIGVSVAIDDFGTGYSSMNYLQQLPVQWLKIDRSFVSATPGDHGSSAIVEAVIGLARAFNLGVVAEGVETEAQMGFLRFMGVDEAQGFLISAPRASEDLVAWLASRERPSE